MLSASSASWMTPRPGSARNMQPIKPETSVDYRSLLRPCALAVENLDTPYNGNNTHVYSASVQALVTRDPWDTLPVTTSRDVPVVSTSRRNSLSPLNAPPTPAFEEPKDTSPPLRSSGTFDKQFLPKVVMARRHRPRMYKAKYDPEMVLMVRDFYEDLVCDGPLAQQRALLRAGGRKKHGSLDEAAQQAVLNAFGDGSYNFRRILKIVFPQANKRDIVSMMALAYPCAPQRDGGEKVELTPEQQKELEEVFMMFDTDGSGEISLLEFVQAVKHLSIPQEEAKQMMSLMDANGDGVISLEEFLQGLRHIYV